MIKWIEVARSWRQTSKEANAPQGNRVALIQQFAMQNGMTSSSVRRCAAALTFAEALQASGRIDDVERLKETSLEKITLMQRVARLSMDEVAKLLPKVLEDNRTIKDLRTDEADIRAKFARSVAAREGANALVSRLGGAAFKTDAANAYVAQAEADGKETVRLTGRGPFIEASHVIAQIQRGGPYHAARIVPAIALGSDPGRHAAIVAQAVALARVFERFDVIAQSDDDAKRITDSVRRVGQCGVAVLLLGDDGILETVHETSRAARPDLLTTHAEELDRLVKQARQAKLAKVRRDAVMSRANRKSKS